MKDLGNEMAELRRAVDAAIEERDQIHQQGFNVLPVNFYSSYSTLVASSAIEANGCGEIVCIEPYPREFLRDISHVSSVIHKPAQVFDAAWFNDALSDNDILFIDSTHTVNIVSDCLHPYLRILPALERNLLVHAHDAFLPEAMPREWALKHHLYWTEQYLLMAYLLDNQKTKILFRSNYRQIMNPERLCRMQPMSIASGGSSLWFSLDPVGIQSPQEQHHG